MNVLGITIVEEWTTSDRQHLEEMHTCLGFKVGSILLPRVDPLYEAVSLCRLNKDLTYEHRVLVERWTGCICMEWF